MTNERQNKREGKRQMLYLGRHARCYNGGNLRNALAPQDRTGSPHQVLAPNDQ
ncbi:MAG: hypothetical protein HC862_03740 [Scytonema sp. RU_4_4]|nr:hypothetical protein [Scytonema sp. RU_4_4]